MSKEQQVRETLKNRPAGVIWSGKGFKINGCFIGLFNGANRVGTLYNNGVFKIGKYECEENWQESWALMAELGLIKYEIKDCCEAYKELHYEITDHGLDVREDDLKYHNEIMSAYEEDRKEQSRNSS